MIYFFILGFVFLTYAVYMLRYDRFCENGLPIHIINIEIRIEREKDSRVTFMTWHTVFVEFNLSKEDEGEHNKTKSLNKPLRSAWKDKKINFLGKFVKFFNQLKCTFIEYSDPDVYNRIGPDKKSAWFETEREAIKFADQLKSIAVSRVNIFGSHMLVSKLPKHRRVHYLSVFIAGLIIIILGIGVGWLQYFS